MRAWTIVANRTRQMQPALLQLSSTPVIPRHCTDGQLDILVGQFLLHNDGDRKFTYQSNTFPMSEQAVAPWDRSMSCPKTCGGGVSEDFTYDDLPLSHSWVDYGVLRPCSNVFVLSSLRRCDGEQCAHHARALLCWAPVRLSRKWCPHSHARRGVLACRR